MTNWFFYNKGSLSPVFFSSNPEIKNCTFPFFKLKVYKFSFCITLFEMTKHLCFDISLIERIVIFLMAQSHCHVNMCKHVHVHVMYMKKGMR